VDRTKAANRVVARTLARAVGGHPTARRCYLTDDHGLYRKGRPEAGAGVAGPRLREPLRPALEVWAHVHSRPEPGLIFLTLGKRDISYDIEPPIPVSWLPAGGEAIQPVEGLFKVVGLNDQHAYVSVPEDHPVKVGDRVGVGCSHPCTTFDKWRYLLLVDDDYGVEQVVKTFF